MNKAIKTLLAMTLLAVSTVSWTQITTNESKGWANKQDDNSWQRQFIFLVPATEQGAKFKVILWQFDEDHKKIELGTNIIRINADETYKHVILSAIRVNITEVYAHVVEAQIGEAIKHNAWNEFGYKCALGTWNDDSSDKNMGYFEFSLIGADRITCNTNLN